MSIDIHRQNGIAHFGSAAAYDEYLEAQHASVDAYTARLRAEREVREHEAQQLQRRHDEAARTAALDQLKAQARAAWGGSASSFEQEWPTIRAEYLRQQAVAAMGVDALVEKKRASGAY